MFTYFELKIFHTTRCTRFAAYLQATEGIAPSIARYYTLGAMEKLWFLFLLGQSTGPVGQNGLHMLLRANENMVGLDLHNERIRKLQDLWQSRTTCKMSSKGTKRQRVWTRLHFLKLKVTGFRPTPGSAPAMLGFDGKHGKPLKLSLSESIKRNLTVCA